MDNYTVTLDYYACTAHVDPQDLGNRLAAFYGGRVILARPKNGYTHAYGIEVGDETVCEMHTRTPDHPWVFASGARSQDLRDALQWIGCVYEVTRVDVALDLFDAEWFPVLVDHGKRWATEHGLVTDQRGDWLNPKRGRTWNLGARSSRDYYRLYEKGRKERVDPNWVRLELEYKPQATDERLAASQATAGQLWAMRAGRVWGRILGMNLEEVFALPETKPTRVRRDVDRARAALAAQYGPTCSTWLRECGGDPVEFVAELMAAIEHQRKVREWAAPPPVNSPELAP